MGYYTRYSLKVKSGSDDTLSRISKAIDDNADAYYGIQSDGNYEAEDCPHCNGTGEVRSYYGTSTFSNEEPCKWYEHEAVMKKLSREFPKTLFELSGEGEESGDIWKKYFKGGKMKTVVAKLSFDEFDESELQ